MTGLLRVGLQYVSVVFSDHTHLLFVLVLSCHGSYFHLGIRNSKCVIRKYHNHKLQTNPWHREEEPHKNHETPGRQQS